ncbi:DNA/RNA non-specific endonuclease [Emcibacter nanhaiensis]|uniref:Endonuclease n=1 Tax=Emcibacter nanhaiensis TaxID=1505037 RepID=A0A501PFS8_9PROT|nr:DNA/RNA non-specific endonuclease [Emcibacter nanhaiensis]TPD59329.1 DNA/RNA non-specific endonuclease [Emcibacter nanhaiensis]
MRHFLTFICSVFIISLSSASGQAGEVHIVHCLKGCPTGAPESNDLIIREIFALSSNDATKFADWVAYRVTSETIGTSKSLNRDWEEDPFLEDNETLEPDDYKSAFNELKTDRGHQAPLASFAGTVFWRSTNILSNITPQKSDLNQGAWVALESAVRDVAYARKEIYVVTGPLYDPNENQMTLPRADESHNVPTGYFKVVATAGGAMTAFIFDQDTDRDDSHCSHIKTLADVESQSGLDLFPEAPSAWPTGDLNAALGCP